MDTIAIPSNSPYVHKFSFASPPEQLFGTDSDIQFIIATGSKVVYSASLANGLLVRKTAINFEAYINHPAVANSYLGVQTRDAEWYISTNNTGRLRNILSGVVVFNTLPSFTVNLPFHADHCIPVNTNQGSMQQATSTAWSNGLLQANMDITVFNAMETITAGDGVMVGIGGCYLAKYETLNGGTVFGVALNSANAGMNVQVVCQGAVTVPSDRSQWNFEIGKRIFVGDSGKLSQTPNPIGKPFSIGYALGSSSLFVTQQSANTTVPRIVSSGSTNLALDTSTADVFDINLTANTTLVLTGGVDGAVVKLRITTNSWVFSFGDVVLPIGTLPLGKNLLGVAFIEYNAIMQKYICTSLVTYTI